MDTSSIIWSKSIKYIASNSSIIPTSGDIYEIMRDDPDKKYLTIIYVGKAEDLRKRYSDHLSEYEENPCIKRNLKNNECYFRYAVVSREEDRQDLEEQLLKEGNFECNVQGQ